MGQQELFEVLKSLPNLDFDSEAEFMQYSVPTFLETLGYNPEDILYELSGQYKVDPVHLDEDQRKRGEDIFRFALL